MIKRRKLSLQSLEHRHLLTGSTSDIGLVVESGEFSPLVDPVLESVVTANIAVDGSLSISTIGSQQLSGLILQSAAGRLSVGTSSSPFGVILQSDPSSAVFASLQPVSVDGTVSVDVTYDRTGMSTEQILADLASSTYADQGFAEVPLQFSVVPSTTNPDPVEPAPVDPAPVDPAPVDPAPVDPAPVDPAPVSSTTLTAAVAEDGTISVASDDPLGLTGLILKSQSGRLSFGGSATPFGNVLQSGPNDVVLVSFQSISFNGNLETDVNFDRSGLTAAQIAADLAGSTYGDESFIEVPLQFSVVPGDVTAPVDPAPVDPAPVDPGPVDPAPVDPVSSAELSAEVGLDGSITFSTTEPTELTGIILESASGSLVGGTNPTPFFGILQSDPNNFVVASLLPFTVDGSFTIDVSLDRQGRTADQVTVDLAASTFGDKSFVEQPLQLSAVELGSVPVDPAPVDPAPVDPAPVDPAPVDPAPVDPVTPSTVNVEIGADGAIAFSTTEPTELTGILLRSPSGNLVGGTAQPPFGNILQSDANDFVLGALQPVAIDGDFILGVSYDRQELTVEQVLADLGTSTYGDKDFVEQPFNLFTVEFPAPIDPTPVDPAPVDPAPVDPTDPPTDPAPTDPVVTTVVDAEIGSDGTITFTTSEPTELTGILLKSDAGNLLVGDDAAPFDGILQSNANSFVLGSLQPISLDGTFTLDVSFQRQELTSDEVLADLSASTFGDKDFVELPFNFSVAELEPTPTDPAPTDPTDPAPTDPVVEVLVTGNISATGEITIQTEGPISLGGLILKSNDARLLAGDDPTPFPSFLETSPSSVTYGSLQTTLVEGTFTLDVTYDRSGLSVEEIVADLGDSAFGDQEFAQISFEFSADAPIFEPEPIVVVTAVALPPFNLDSDTVRAFPGEINLQFSDVVTVDDSDLSRFVLVDSADNSIPVDSVEYDAEAKVATFKTAADSADYLFRILGGVKDADGQEFDGNGDGEVGGTFEIPAMIALGGDTDLDGDVDFADFLMLSENYAEESYPNLFDQDLPDGPAIWLHGDFDGDGSVSFPDFLLLSRNFGTPV